ncbi:peptidoglycan-binding domain-containing protein [Alkalihalobacterium elongatum]|uniref:peptidoglycan-binding domain-containing protein n=1 Tax=Alkalihalobacterium elongatum TaxID=2675466 RepID=UPI001F42CEF9|nr:peptidoglycan-binding domain-containing protein [Alkalihalobacterium elongatum]
MHNDEVQWLFNKVKVNTTVIITSSKQSFDTIAKANGYKITASSTVPVSTNSSTILRRGSKGEPVKELQRQLTSLGYNTRGIDGIFGPATEAAVRNFQKSKKLTVDGVVGPQTKRALSKQ